MRENFLQTAAALRPARMGAEGAGAEERNDALVPYSFPLGKANRRSRRRVDEK